MLPPPAGSPGGALKPWIVTVAEPARSIGGISSDAVLARTGKTWEEWLHALDRAGARRLAHRAIVALVGRKSRAGAWWRRMVAVGYEQARGLGVRRQAPSGFQISASRTLSAPARVVFLHWAEARRRRTWLPHQALKITSKASGRTIRAVWGAGRERLEVTFAGRPGRRTRVTVFHRQLATQAAARRAQAFWKSRLAMLARAVRTEI